jgi:putative molybdopterin biosynthesis protein
MVKADGILRIPPLSEGINAGEEAVVELLRPRSEITNTIVLSGSHDPALGLLEDALKSDSPQLKLSTSNVGSLGGLLAMKRNEAHVIGTHLLDPKTGTYNLPDVRRHLRPEEIVVVNLVVRQQGLLVLRGNPKGIKGLEDLVRPDVTFVNRQPGAGTRVLLDYELAQLKLRTDRIQGYEREEFTHMAVAVAIASGLADCGVGVRSAANALDLDFIPIAQEDYDLVLRRDFYDGPAGQALMRAIRSASFRDAVTNLGGYATERCGEVKPLIRPRGRAPAAVSRPPRRRKRLARSKG